MPSTLLNGASGSTSACVDGTTPGATSLELDDFSLRVLEAVRIVGQPLLGRGDGGWTAMYVVLERTSRAAITYKGVIVDCSRAIKTSTQGQAFMSDWSRQGGSAIAPPPARKHGGCGGGGQDPVRPPVPEDDDDDSIDVDACLRDTASMGQDGGLGEEPGAVDVFPDLAFNTRSVIQQAPSALMGKQTLTAAEIHELMTSCGLRTYKQLTFYIIKIIFANGSKALKAQKAVANFEWTQICPPLLRHNK